MIQEIKGEEMQDAHELMHKFTCMLKKEMFGQQEHHQRQDLFSSDLLGVIVYSICHCQAIRLGEE